MSTSDRTHDPLGIGPRLRDLDTALRENDRLREALRGMCYQFGHHFERDGRRHLGTMGLSDLEYAFEVLGWDDPHPYDPDEALTPEAAEEAGDGD